MDFLYAKQPIWFPLDWIFTDHPRRNIKPKGGVRTFKMNRRKELKKSRKRRAKR